MNFRANCLQQSESEILAHGVFGLADFIQKYCGLQNDIRYLARKIVQVSSLLKRYKIEKPLQLILRYTIYSQHSRNLNKDFWNLQNLLAFANSAYANTPYLNQ